MTMPKYSEIDEELVSLSYVLFSFFYYSAITSRKTVDSRCFWSQNSSETVLLVAESFNLI